jgi:initiation factor 1A
LNRADLPPTLINSPVKYEKVENVLRKGRIEVNHFDGIKLTATILGKLSNRVLINIGDIIFLSFHESRDEKAELFHKYYPEKANGL